MNHDTILIVEDNLILRDGLQDILAEEGFQVLVAANGREALEVMEDPDSSEPSLILSDIAMPEMDGMAFFKAVRSRQDWIAIPFIFLTARGDREDIRAGKNLGVEDYLVKPVTPEDLVSTIRVRLQRSHQIQMVQLQKALESMLTMFANAIEVRDPYTKGHVTRVTAYSLSLANQMKLSHRMMEQVRFGAILHDIGKIILGDGILRKPGELNDNEWQEIRLHPISGALMIQDIPYLAPALPAIRHHHERWDGHGYPDQLAGSDIPLSARIVSVADSFDAMTTQRPYSSIRTAQEAYEEILNRSGQQYDPSVVAAFQQAWELGEIQDISSRPLR
jgi:putative two-component system response regulator